MGLLQEYGAQEFAERVVGCMIEYNGKPVLTRQLVGTNVVSYAYSGTPEKPVKEAVNVPVDYFENMTSLKYPQLGYRSAAAGQFLTYLSRIPTATRKGLHNAQIKSSRSPLTDYLQVYGDFDIRNHFDSGDARIIMIFQPQMMSWQDGLRKVREGSILSFVVDENFACVPSTRQGKYLDILYRERIIGTMSERGDISINSVQANDAWIQATKDRVYAAS